MEPVQITPKASQDIAKLAQGVYRAQVALEALRESNLSPDQVKQLEALLKTVSPTGGAASATTSAAGGRIATQSHTGSRFEAYRWGPVAESFVFGRMTVNGREMDTLLSEGSLPDSKTKPEMVASFMRKGYRLATREEHAAYVNNLLGKEADGSINSAERVALRTCRTRARRDTQAEFGAFRGRVGDPEFFLDVEVSPDFGALFVRVSAEGRNEEMPAAVAISPEQKARLEVAQELVGSYSFDKKTGISTFTVPAGISDVEAMKSLNEYFRSHHSHFGRDAVYAKQFDWFEELPQAFPTYCQERDYSQARQITIMGVVKGSEGADPVRATQEEALKTSLSLSDPRDQALAGAIHACKHDGEDLFQDLWVCGSVPGVAVGTYRPKYGIFVGKAHMVRFLGNFAASGTPPKEFL